MKKWITVCMVLVLAFSLLTLTGCDTKKEQPYSQYDLAEYITLPDYDAYETDVPDVDITEDHIDGEIQERLEAAATTERVTKGTVEEGDTVQIFFKGTLADGTTDEGMQSDNYTLTLGSGTMIDGFEEGLYGATIGKPLTLELQFPDPYENNEELSGQDVTFEVTVLSKDVQVVPELDEDFIKNNSDVETEEEYREYIRGQLEQDEYDNQLYDLKNSIYTQIVEETEVFQYPEEEVEEQVALLNDTYRDMAENYGYEDWDEFLDQYFAIDQTEYDEQIRVYAESIVKQEMIIYAIAQKEGIEVTEEEYQSYIEEMLASSGFSDEDAFEEYAGMTIDEYAETYKLDRDLLLTKELDTIYDRLSEKIAE